MQFPMQTKTIMVLAIAMLTTAQPFKAAAQSRNSNNSSAYETISNVLIESRIDELINENKKLAEKNEALENRLNQIERDLSQCCMSFKQIVSGRQSAEMGSADEARLEQNTPNPFREKTVIKYYVPLHASEASIKIYSIFGSELLAFPLSSKGSGQVEFAGKTLSAGTYTYILVVDGKAVDSRRMVLIRE